MSITLENHPDTDCFWSIRQSADGINFGEQFYGWGTKKEVEHFAAHRAKVMEHENCCAFVEFEEADETDPSHEYRVSECVNLSEYPYDEDVIEPDPFQHLRDNPGYDFDAEVA